MAYFHGITQHELTEGPVYYRRADFSSIGMIATMGDDADSDTFEYFKPTFLTGTTGRELAGEEGTLKIALDSIYDQIAPRILVVPIPATAADDAEMEANKILGVRSLEAAQAQYGFKPRILGAPGLETLTLAQEMVSMADKTRGFYYGLALADTAAEAVAYRANFGSKRLMLIYPSFDDHAEQSIRTVASALGLRALTDQDKGIARCLSNQPIQTNISGVTDAVDWDFTDPNTTANYLNENEITTIIKRDGWRFWGCRTTSAEAEYAFESVVRKGDQLLETISEAQFAVMANKLVPALTTTLLDEVQRVLDQETVREELLGGKAYYAEGYNDITTLRDGQLHLHYDYTVPPPLEQPHFYAVNTGSYLLNALP
ncbi:MAG: phage tail protein [Gammaproteobacteria bacterium]|nr:MAG: phage tail protein [Gammaproteobacteria bacterium]